MLILLFLVSLLTTENEGRPFRTTTEAPLKVDPAFYNRTAQLIQLVSHLDDDDPVDPESTDFRKQYYPDHKSYEYFNTNWTDDTGPRPLDLYRDLVKLIMDTNQEGITGTVQVFATSQAPGIMRRQFRRHHVKNPEVIDQYRRKRKKSKKSKKKKSKKHSTSSDSDDGSDESLGMRRRFDSEDDESRYVTVRRMREIDRSVVSKNPRKPEARISELNFEKVPSLEEGTYLRSLYVGGNQDDFGWVKNDDWNTAKKTDNQDIFGNQGNDWDQPKAKEQDKQNIAWDDDAWRKKTTEKSHKLKNNEWDNVGIPNNNHKKGKWDDILEKQDKNKKKNWDDDLGKSDPWGKQDKKKAENEWDKPKPKIDKWDEPKKAKISDWDKPLATKKSVDDYDKPKKNLDDDWSKPKKKDNFDTYGNKKVKEYDDYGTPKKKDKAGDVEKDDWNDSKKKKGGWNDYDEPKTKYGKDKKSDLRTKPKNDEWDNSGRSKKDDWGKKESWDDKYTKKDTWNEKSTKKDTWDSKPKKKSSWDDKPIKKDSWEDKPIKKDSWDDKPIKRDSNKKTKKDSWEKPQKKDSWEVKPKKKDSWETSPKKWNDQKDKDTKGWDEPKKSRDWDPPPPKKRKHDEDDYYERPRSKHAKRDRDMLNVRTPIPFIGKRGIYEDV